MKNVCRLIEKAVFDKSLQSAAVNILELTDDRAALQCQPIYKVQGDRPTNNAHKCKDGQEIELIVTMKCMSMDGTFHTAVSR